jgi:twitching motility protein PilT
MRDRDSLALAISAAETGQLVLGSLHTQSAVATVDRILDAFPADQQSQVRAQLAESLKGVVAQKLVKRADGRGRAAAVEILFGTQAVSSLIRERKTFQLPSVMRSSRNEGMQTFEDSLLALVRAGTVLPEEAADYGIDIEAIERAARESQDPAMSATDPAAEAEANAEPGGANLFGGLPGFHDLEDEPRPGSLASRVSPR